MFSFNSSTISRFPLAGFTLDWYARLLDNRAMHEAIGNSLIVAFATVVVTLTLGITGAVGIHRYTGRWAAALRAFSLTPMMVPLLKPAIIAAGLVSFTLSFDEVIVTFFTTGRENTLPMVIWSMLRFGLTPEVKRAVPVHPGQCRRG